MSFFDPTDPMDFFLWRNSSIPIQSMNAHTVAGCSGQNALHGAKKMRARCTNALAAGVQGDWASGASLSDALTVSWRPKSPIDWRLEIAHSEGG